MLNFETRHFTYVPYTLISADTQMAIPYHSWCDTLKKTFCSLAANFEHRYKFLTFIDYGHVSLSQA